MGVKELRVHAGQRAAEVTLNLPPELSAQDVGDLGPDQLHAGVQEGVEDVDRDPLEHHVTGAGGGDQDDLCQLVEGIAALRAYPVSEEGDGHGATDPGDAGGRGAEHDPQQVAVIIRLDLALRRARGFEHAGIHCPLDAHLFHLPNELGEVLDGMQVQPLVPLLHDGPELIVQRQTDNLCQLVQHLWVALEQPPHTPQLVDPLRVHL
mmetsp:Transcript_148174/g.258988  ORF Transcript_148174/g.258988 Transcript_148174/m.258988 type:complete len:207 (+) Transcript_148174:784-1404(+)